MKYIFRKCLLDDCDNLTRAIKHGFCRKHRQRSGLRKQYHHEWYEKIRVDYKKYRLKSRYNLSLEQYNKMKNEQEDLCKICLKPETTIHKKYGRTRTLAVDHCHTTGKIRGLLCENCNRALGLIKDNTKTLINMIKYLEVNNV